jgi:hypothetical protein
MSDLVCLYRGTVLDKHVDAALRAETERMFERVAQAYSARLKNRR